MEFCFSPSLLKNMIHPHACGEYLGAALQFQSFFSGKLFGKDIREFIVSCPNRVSILLLWKVIWKETFSLALVFGAIGFNPSSLESYLESIDVPGFEYIYIQFQSFFSGKLFGKSTIICLAVFVKNVSILLLWKVIWKDVGGWTEPAIVTRFNPSSLESYLESRCVGR